MFYKNSHNIKTAKKSSSLSIIIAFRNEELHLKDCLDSIAAQKTDAKAFELILVDDHSTDRSKEIAQQFIKNHRTLNVQLWALEADQKGKKAALKMGVDKSKNQTILTADADCIYDPFWAKEMLGEFDAKDLKMLCGSVHYHAPKTEMQWFIYQERKLLNYLSEQFLKAHRPLMNSGANLMYTKQGFDQVGAYESNQHIASGDDVFLMQDFHKKFYRKIGFLNKEHCFTVYPNDVNEFFEQRVRWAKKTFLVKHAFTWFIGALFSTANLLFFFALILAFFWPEFLIIVIVKIVIDLFVGDRAGLKEHQSFILSFCYPFYLLSCLYMGFVLKPKWKDRALKY